MANPTGSNAAKGDLAKTTGIEVISRKSDGTGCSKGEIVHFSTAGLAVLGTTSGTIADGYGVALEDVAANADGRFAVVNTWVYVLAGETIIPFNLVDIDATDGRAGSHSEPANASLNSIFAETESQDAINRARNYFVKTGGRYI